MMKAYFTFISLALVLFSTTSHATITSATGNNIPASVQVNTPGSSTINWQVIKTVPRANTVKVFSSLGIFKTPSGQVLQRVSAEIVNTLTIPAGGDYTFSMRESLQIPLAIIRELQNQGENVFFYERTFSNSEDGSQKTAVVRFSIQSTDSASSAPATNASGSVSNNTNANQNTSPLSNTSHLRINRTQLRFDNERRSVIVDTETEFGAYAVINYTGSGVISYTWEVATPPSTMGQPNFRPIETHLQHLLAGGKITISSPSLPSRQTGEYLLRLKITQPSPGITSDELRYSVKSNTQNVMTTEPDLMNVQHPPLNALISPQTEFRWLPIPGATAYQLEIYDSPQISNYLVSNLYPRPVTGVIIPANKTTVILGNASWAHLKIGQSYYWRVIALSDDGRIVGQSKLFEIQTP